MRRLLLLPALALALTACSSSPESTLRGDVEDVIAAANSNDGEGVRLAVDDLLGTIREQVANNELDDQDAARLRELALAVQQNAGLLDPAAPSPSPTPSEQEPSEEPSPTPSEEPSPTPSEEPSPSPTEEEEEEEPSPEPSLPNPLEPSPSAEPSPAGVAASPDPAASPATSPAS